MVSLEFCIAKPQHVVPLEGGPDPPVSPAKDITQVAITLRSRVLLYYSIIM